MPWKPDTKAHLCFCSSCPTLVLYRLEKVLCTSEALPLFLHESRIKFISNQFD